MGNYLATLQAAGEDQDRARAAEAGELPFNKSLLGEPIVSDLREGCRPIMIMMMTTTMMINTQPVIKWCFTDISAQRGSSEFSRTRAADLLSVHLGDGFAMFRGHCVSVHHGSTRKGRDKP